MGWLESILKGAAKQVEDAAETVESAAFYMSGGSGNSMRDNVVIGGRGGIVVNGKRYQGNSVSVINNRVFIDGIEQTSGLTGVVKIEVTGDLKSLIADAPVTVQGDVHGNVDARGSVSCAAVGGSVDAGGSVSCASVQGDVDAGGSVSCGTVGGDIDAGGSVRHGS